MIRLLLKDEYSIIEVGAKLPQGGFTRNTIIQLDKIEDFRAKHNNIDIYRTVYQYNKPNQNESDLYAAMYFDLDNNDLTDSTMEMIAFEEVREDAKKILAILEAIFYIPQEQIQIYFSGGKGLHIIVPPEVMGIQPCKFLNNVYRIIATDVKKYLTFNTIDTKIYDNKRLFRIENSIHGKTGLYKIPLSASELRSLSFADVKLLASKKRDMVFEAPVYSTKANRMYNKFVDEWDLEVKKIEERKTKGVGDYKYTYTPPCIAKLLKDGMGEGGRNNGIAILSSFFKQSGLTEDQCINKMSLYNQQNVTPSLVEREVVRTVISVYSGNYKYGCRSLVDLELCSPKCKIAQNKVGGK